MLDFFLNAISGDRNAIAMGIDVYSALDMAIPGLLAYRSILNGGNVVEIPDFRDPAVREQYRNDIACTDPDVAGDQLLPSCSTWQGTVPDEVYEEEAALFEEAMKTHSNWAFIKETAELAASIPTHRKNSYYLLKSSLFIGVGQHRDGRADYR